MPPSPISFLTPGKAAWAIFDPVFYAARVRAPPDLDSPDALLEHYRTTGSRAGLSPNRWFDEAWYRTHHPDVEQLIRQGEFPCGFVHYSALGHADRAPHWLFDPAFYRAANPGLTDDTLSRAGFADLYDHYLKCGAREGRRAHPLFDPAAFAAEAPAVQAAQIEETGAFRHFLSQTWGAAEPRVSSAFNPGLYRATYPDAARLIDEGHWHSALHHYLANRHLGLFDPLPGPQAQPAPRGAKQSWGKIHVDRPANKDGRALEPIVGRLEIAGWAIADDPVASIDLFMDDIWCGRARQGIRTDGLASAFPEHPDTMFAGFRLAGPDAIAPGLHRLRMVARGPGGVACSTTFEAEFQPSERRDGPWSPRGRMHRSEAELKLRLLRDCRQEPCFVILLDRAKDPDRAMDSLRRQVYPHWRLYDGAVNDTDWIVPLDPADALGVDALLELALHRLVEPATDFLDSGPRGNNDQQGRLWAASARLVGPARLDGGMLDRLEKADLRLRLTEVARQASLVPLLLCGPGEGRHDTVARQAELEFTRHVFPSRPFAVHDSIRRILAVKLDHIGDFVIGLAALRRLKAHFPRAELTVLVAPAVHAVAAAEPAVDKVIAFEFFHARSALGPRELAPGEMTALSQRLQAERFDLAVDLRYNGRTRPILLETGATWLAGFDPATEFPWLDIVAVGEAATERREIRTNMADSLLDFADKVAASFAPTPVGISPTVDDSTAPGDGQLRIAIHPGAGNPMRQWPADHFITLIDLLTDALDCRIVLVGGVEDGALATHISGKVRNSARVTCAAGSVTLERLPALLAGCDLFIGNNSGPQHLAAALNVPTIGIHSGVVATREWAPNGSSAVAIGRATICAPCYIAKPEDCPRALACLTDLSPESVLRLARTMLAPAAARRAGSGAERG